MDECGGMRTATLLVAIMILAPFAQAVEVHIRATELIVQPNPNGELSNLTEDAFSIPANSTILDGWVNVSTGSNGDGGSGTHWNINSPTLNFSHGTFSDSSISVFDHELTLDVNHTVGRIDDLETLSMRFQQYSPGGMPTFGDGRTLSVQWRLCDELLRETSCGRFDSILGIR